MKRRKQVTRAAVEQAVDLLKEASDWLPPLKSAVGGVAFILNQIRLCEDNAAACDQLTLRIVQIGNDLCNCSRLAGGAPDVAERVQHLVRFLLDMAQKLEAVRKSGKLSAHALAKREKLVLDGCWAELNAAVVDTNLCVTLLKGTQLNAGHASLISHIDGGLGDIVSHVDAGRKEINARYANLVSHNNSRHDDLISHIQSLHAKLEPSQPDSDSKIVASIGTPWLRCSLLRNEIQDRLYIHFEADASIVLFASEVRGGGLCLQII